MNYWIAIPLAALLGSTLVYGAVYFFGAVLLGCLMSKAIEQPVVVLRNMWFPGNANVRPRAGHPLTICCAKEGIRAEDAQPGLPTLPLAHVMEHTVQQGKRLE